MKITAVHGTERKGITYNISKEVISYLNNTEAAEMFKNKVLL